MRYSAVLSVVASLNRPAAVVAIIAWLSLPVAAQEAQQKNADAVQGAAKAAQPAPGRRAAGPMVAAANSILAHAPTSTFVHFTPDGKQLITGGTDTLVQIWDLQTGNPVRPFAGHLAGISGGALSSDGRMLVTSSWDQTLRIWQVESGKTEKPLSGHLEAVISVALSPDNKTIASGGNDLVFRLWNVEQRKATFTSPNQTLPVNRIAISPDGKLVATGSGRVTDWRRAGEVKLWNAATGEELALLPGHGACVNTVAFSPDGKQLASGSAEGKLYIWDVAKRDELLATNLGLGVRTVLFIPDTEILVIGQYPARVLLWDMPTRRPIITYAGHATPQAMVDHLALSPDGSLIASAGTDGMVYLWPVPEKTPDGKTRLRPMPAEGKPTTAELVTKWTDPAPAGAATNKPDPKP